MEPRSQRSMFLGAVSSTKPTMHATTLHGLSARCQIGTGAPFPYLPGFYFVDEGLVSGFHHAKYQSLFEKEKDA